jgi:hypothetical protein
MSYKKKSSTIKLNSAHSVDTKRAKVVFYFVTCDLQSTGSIGIGRTTSKSRLWRGSG